MHEGDNYTHQLLKVCCVLRFHQALCVHYFMDPYNKLTSIHNQPCEDSEAQKVK